MSHRLQVLIPEEMDRLITKAAKRVRISKGEWVRRVLEAGLRPPMQVAEGRDPLERLESLEAPTGNVADMVAEVDQGRV